ncbi:Cell adhesion molecule 2 like protein [Argiope bruennichi]|uniref:Cell adhesion molecule 2 like protein n=1 Tax=Argiope bruennichi TaxID=94029 RepID=A0A8T0F2G9_ARGBR|nr:Cell adhesion molecule 2 like protein [Argiope bruennichi]
MRVVAWRRRKTCRFFPFCYLEPNNCIIHGLSSGLKFVQLDIPGALHSGESTWLKCQYELGEDELYSVKWYKNNVEFFRYLPSDMPAGQNYELLGVYVDLPKSNATHVYLYKTDLNTEGTYGCEVSTEAPSFRTVKADKELRIYVLPTNGPVIEGIDPPYQIDDVVNISCTSGPSKPTAHMKWFINDKEYSPTSESRYPAMRHPNGLQTTRIDLEFKIDHSHFYRGEIKIVCMSSIPQVYSSTSEELVIGDRGSSINPYHVSHSAPGQKGPVIDGNLPWYHVGDLVNLTCSSAKSPIPVHIRWFVNDMEAKQEHIIKYPTIRYSDGTEVSSLGLRMRVEHHHFKSDELRIKCTTTLYRMLTMRAEKTLFSSAQKQLFFHDFSVDLGLYIPVFYNKTITLLLIVITKEIIWMTIALK